MAEHTSFLFANWNPTQIRIVCQLIPLLCRHGAGLYGVDFPRGSDVQEVRVGWPNPNSSVQSRLGKSNGGTGRRSPQPDGISNMGARCGSRPLSLRATTAPAPCHIDTHVSEME